LNLCEFHVACQEKLAACCFVQNRILQFKSLLNDSHAKTM